MGTRETTTYVTYITLSTEQGELPSDIEVERLVADQMSGVLDGLTGLSAIAVGLIERNKISAEVLDVIEAGG